MSTITRKAEHYPKCAEYGLVEIVNILLYAEGSLCRKVNLHSRKFLHSEMDPVDQLNLGFQSKYPIAKGFW